MSDATNTIGLTPNLIQAGIDIDPVLLAEGLETIRQEKNETLGETFRLHWRAILWSMTLSLALVMDGYDGSITTAFYGLPAFLERFGVKNSKGKLVIDANYQTAIANILIPGNFLAFWVVGAATKRWGMRPVYAGGMVLITLIIFLFVFLQSIQMLLVAQLLVGFCWGLFHTLTAAYAAEICPIRLRGMAVSFISFCWGTGGFIAAGLNRAALDIQGDWSWRLPYCLQWIWPVPLFFAAIYAPESPYWLVRVGKIDQAKKCLTRIRSPGYWDSHSLDGYIEFIRHTDHLESAESSKGSFMEMFKGTNLRRTEIMLGVWTIQQWSGLSLTGYAIVFLKSVGWSTTAAFNLNMVITAMNLVGCALELFVINRFGRRPLILWGMTMLMTLLLLIGILGSVPFNHHVIQAIASFLILLNLIFHATIGPVTYTVAAEIPSSRLRQRTVAFGRGWYVANGVATGQLTPRMVNPKTTPGAWGWGAKAGYFYFGVAVVVTTWAYFRMPETGGFSFAELEILFANKVNARKFTKQHIHDEMAAGDSAFDTKPGEMDDDLKAIPQLEHNEYAK
ncbi:hypothetical protein CcaverHIS002_0210210 [Cutaneotrichosporon cavernicola]|uniref:Major facilitator superfamily (MFS) profile domain-containing protein n=1 Tax=Cutaneotrichosporon cavernicola TaxID=279322 RepID=A0AA48L0B4_9TREE|nr:uncharacterized protein CcaverHIS019_0210230 [Cutaneotrichosporon cavernicola]BEI81861.1 hypothetical protein CcaverHIS002_0210210 [Cutaneotrichosporon cavernicola]BEI89661.1 hypothetical protein CcaverHIS019_0210230 [Cutaneotrichosporon cavernicola]BEI97432.1 hypothetical protein CcaverHIS631_0210210 [Cutaneotrichosporon cavernicola]BEJ05210.1 hypothetical protein CcaverHIS641_0210270 [Cutaneotrichosporon cavernicola]